MPTRLHLYRHGCSRWPCCTGVDGCSATPYSHAVRKQWEVTAVEAHEGLVPYGPGGDRLPGRFTAFVEYTERPLRLKIEATFDGTRKVQAHAVAVDRTDGESVTPQDMAATQLGAVMSSVVFKATRHGRGTIMRGGRRDQGPLTDEELLALARTYWFHYMSWGKPRQAVMSDFELPRSTANYWIRRAREKYGLPGQHADEEEGSSDGVDPEAP
jgi:hypothetical protein